MENKETLEEAAERLVKETTLYGSQEASIGSSARSYFETELRCVLLGMQWQQERSYSKEEFEQILIDITLFNPKHLSMLRSGYGEFPDSYELTENGVDYIIEQLKKK